MRQLKAAQAEAAEAKEASAALRAEAAEWKRKMELQLQASANEALAYKQRTENLSQEVEGLKAAVAAQHFEAEKALSLARESAKAAHSVELEAVKAACQAAKDAELEAMKSAAQAHVAGLEHQVTTLITSWRAFELRSPLSP